jgi:hypothetical protein
VLKLVFHFRIPTSEFFYMPSADTPYLVSKFLKYTAYCVFPFTRKRLPVMILQIGISSILLKLLIEEERVDAAIVTNGQNSRV